MAESVRIAVDAMGGDHGEKISVPAVLASLSQFPHLSVTLVGDEDDLGRELQLATPNSISRLTLKHAEDVVSMEDKPSFALRNKPQSSMRLSLELLQRQEVDAVVSAGNTGALMAIGRYVLKTLPGIDRPAICTALPTLKQPCYLLDLGANVDCCAEHLQQFAMMGSVMASTVDGLENPRVALLNIGAEDIKGNEQVRLAATFLESDENINYVGFVEGDTLFQGAADIVVCDGFVGNVALKTCEGTADLVTQRIKSQFQSSWRSRLLGRLAQGVLKNIYSQIDPHRYNGGWFLGLQGVVVKSHGNTTVQSFQRAISQALVAVESNMLEKMDSRLAVLGE